MQRQPVRRTSIARVFGTATATDLGSSRRFETALAKRVDLPPASRPAAPTPSAGSSTRPATATSSGSSIAFAEANEAEWPRGTTIPAALALAVAERRAGPSSRERPRAAGRRGADLQPGRSPGTLTDAQCGASPWRKTPSTGGPLPLPRRGAMDGSLARPYGPVLSTPIGGGGWRRAASGRDSPSPETLDSIDYWIVLYQASPRIPEARFRPIFDDVQWRVLMAGVCRRPALELRG